MAFNVMHNAQQFSDAPQSVAKRAAQLRIKALTLAGDMKQGTFSSLYRGRGIEFSGVREYLAGDDVRAIDWNVTARMGKPFIKQFQEERELVIFIVLDCSRSMISPGFFSRGGKGEKKLHSTLHAGCETASLAALAGNFGGCPVGTVIFAGNILFSSVPRFGTRHIMEMLSRFDANSKKNDEDADAAHNGTALPLALSGAAKLLKNRALIFVISDFRAARWEQPFALLCAKHDVIALRITNQFEEEFPSLSRVPFVDPETGLTQTLPTSSARFRRGWEADCRMRNSRWLESVVSCGGYPLKLSAHEDPFTALSRFFAATNKKPRSEKS